MPMRTLWSLLALLTVAVTPALAQQPVYHDIHSMDMPRPPVVTPGTATNETIAPPSDAIILFDGTDLSNWVSQREGNAPAEWIVRDGYMEVVPGTGGIQTKQMFGDVQLHIEWASPEVIEGDGQGRGNSGVFFMNTYEVQVLDVYENDTYPDGQATAIYGQHIPLANAMRPRGEWQSYDIVFRRPHFDDDGNVIKPARFTVFHNGVVTQDAVYAVGPTSHKQRTPYKAHADALPLGLQDHSNPVRFRNIWIREL
ncbi:MAG: DUF1080 domain-containing protein [Bacteroidota bacterium]